MSTELFLAFLAAITLLTITPGVDTLLVMRNTARGGRQDGFVTSLGICCGLFIHAALSALGISIILVETAWAFASLKWAGACYLIWLGLASLYAAWRGPAGQRSPAHALPPVSAANASIAFREGLLSNLLNPKTALFYMALLPQFIDPQGAALQQSLLLAAVHFVLAMLWQCGLAVVVAKSGGLRVPGSVKRALGGLTGAFFVAMGTKLASA